MVCKILSLIVGEDNAACGSGESDPYRFKDGLELVQRQPRRLFIQSNQRVVVEPVPDGFRFCCKPYGVMLFG